MIRLNLPLIDDKELEEVKKVLESGYLTQGPKVAEFENLCKEFLGCQFAFATSSCTTALHLSLVALGIEAGDEVLVPDFTFPATANVAVQIGAIPILVDIDLNTFTVNPDDLKRKITPRSRAVIPVHTFGCSADMDPIIAIAKQHGLKVIEDAACAFGTTYKDHFCGNLSDAGCFSFHPRKAITTAEGGLITCEDPELAERISLLRSHGGRRLKYWFSYEAAGFNYRLSDVQGALGVAQMEKLDYILKEKRVRARQLSQVLAGIPHLTLPQEPSWGGHVFQSYVILVDGSINRDRIIEDMRGMGVETTLGTYALHDQPFFQATFGYKSGQLPNSHYAFDHSVTLPLYPQLTADDLGVIRDALQKAVKDQI